LWTLQSSRTIASPQPTAEMVATVAMVGLAAMAAQEGSAGIQIATGLGAPRQAVTEATGAMEALAAAAAAGQGARALL